MTKSKNYSDKHFILVHTKNKFFINSIFSFRVHVTLKVEIDCIKDGKKVDEINEDFTISFSYKNLKWMVISVEQLSSMP